MKFLSLPVERAEGTFLAHSVRLADGSIRKGTRLDAGHGAMLLNEGIKEVTAAILEAGDIHEDEAAVRLAKAVAGSEVRADAAFTGRVNLYAEKAGLLLADRQMIDRLNRLDPSLTIATLPEYARVEAGRMLATVKIIPFAAPEEALARAEQLVGDLPPLRVAPFRPLTIGMVVTQLPSLKASVMDKTRRVLDARLAKAGAVVAAESRVAHEVKAVAAALSAQKAAGFDLFIVFGASAMVDARDVVPAGIEAAGGKVLQLGMPVDPGNLLLLGELGGTPILGAPGCARSPAENGFDLVLDRLLAGVEVGAREITGMGVGGLLSEIVSRPQPREAAGAAAPRVAALILAAGLSSRMGGGNKLLAEIGGRPLVRIAVEAALASKAAKVSVVTGHMADEISRALSGLDVSLVHNPNYAQGLSTSLKAGVESVAGDIDGVLVLLADMPAIGREAIDSLIAAFYPGLAIVVPTFEGKRGNPVLWPSRHFGALAAVTGDKGARDLIALYPGELVEVEIGKAAAFDLDTRQALEAAGAQLPGIDSP